MRQTIQPSLEGAKKIFEEYEKTLSENEIKPIWDMAVHCLRVADHAGVDLHSEPRFFAGLYAMAGAPQVYTDLPLLGDHYAELMTDMTCVVYLLLMRTDEVMGRME